MISYRDYDVFIMARKAQKCLVAVQPLPESIKAILLPNRQVAREAVFVQLLVAGKHEADEAHAQRKNDKKEVDEEDNQPGIVHGAV